jgi:hypothetical protein
VSNYIDVVKVEKKFIGNVVVLIGGQYFATRQPDSGLAINFPYSGAVASLTINPVQIDPRRVSTPISGFSFKLLDKDGSVSAMVMGDAASLNNQPARIWVGRSFTGMDFAEYFELPQTYIQKWDHSDSGYTVTTTEQASRMDRPIYAFESALAVDILAATTTFTMRDPISSFPTSGFLKCEDEFVSYTGLDLINNRVTGIIRGELGSTPVDHAVNSDCVLVETVTDNPLNIILKILCSNGGGGAYDILQDGLGILASLIDIAGIEALRDELFFGVEFTLSLYSIDSALKIIENELLMPNGLRFSYSDDSKLTLVILDKARFVEEDDVINEDTITKFPKWSIDGSKVTNIIQVQWDFNEGTNQFQKRNVYQDDASIALYGAQPPLSFDLRGPKAALNGQELMDDFGTRLLGRLSTPTPTVVVNTHLDKSLQNIGDKAFLVSNKVPAGDGTLNFNSNLEIIARSINQTTGDVQFTLAFTSFTNIRSGFIAPSDLITSFVAQNQVNIIKGRYVQYLVGWYMKLWDQTNQVYMPDPPNKIIAIEPAGDASYLLDEDGDRILTEQGDPIILEDSPTEDSIIFENDWVTTLESGGRFRIRFCQYDDAVDSQKRYCFLSDSGNNFADGKPTYRITY